MTQVSFEAKKAAKEPRLAQRDRQRMPHRTTLLESRDLVSALWGLSSTFIWDLSLSVRASMTADSIFSTCASIGSLVILLPGCTIRLELHAQEAVGGLRATN